MRILITGINGFVGGHLLERLRSEPGHAIHGFSRSDWRPNLRHLAGSAALHRIDLLDEPSLDRSVRSIQPDRIYHLAGYASTGKSFKEPHLCFADNVLATRNLLQAAAGQAPQARILMISTGLVYGEASGPDDAFDESRPLRPMSPYAASKAAADLMSFDAFRSGGQAVVRMRPFNHIGPRMSAEYAAGNFARQVANIILKKSEPSIETGDLSALRDLSDVRDVIEAYVLAMEKGRPGEVYNVGSGKAVSMNDLLNHFINMAGVPVDVRQKPDPNRAGDTSVTRCDAAKIRRELGWQPRYELGQTARDILDYWLHNPVSP